jgi:hypothetical protein
MSLLVIAGSALNLGGFNPGTRSFRLVTRRFSETA